MAYSRCGFTECYIELLKVVDELIKGNLPDLKNENLNENSRQNNKYCKNTVART